MGAGSPVRGFTCHAGGPFSCHRKAGFHSRSVYHTLPLINVGSSVPGEMPKVSISRFHLGPTGRKLGSNPPSRLTQFHGMSLARPIQGRSIPQHSNCPGGVRSVEKCLPFCEMNSSLPPWWSDWWLPPKLLVAKAF